MKDDPIEAPFICQHGGRFHLFFSFDYCCGGKRSNYKVAIGCATQLAGPCLDESGMEMLEGGGTMILRRTTTCTVRITARSCASTTRTF